MAHSSRMPRRRTRTRWDSRLFLPWLLIAGLLLLGCSKDDGSGEARTTATVVTNMPADGIEVNADTNAGCFVHLFDSEDFRPADGSYLIVEPGRYPNLSGLPGAQRDWTDEADSLRVGPGATVTIWSDTDFTGRATQLEPGSEHRDLRDEPSSLELTC